ncbi:MAG: NAD-dependent epimerase/dehydratase family protein [Verrucomicrobiaceae bacterium]|nr:NAD-dependent epimerase/dehydratase family protein [Verrucomicrobiaceae bacterium]
MKTAIITGSCGLVGSEAALRLHADGWRIVGIDNDMRRYFFGDEASTDHLRQRLVQTLQNYEHHQTDIRDATAVERVFAQYAGDIAAVIHTAAQPSHDWAVREPLTDFGVNACGTLHVLEAARKHAFDVPFVFTSTSKVYGDTPNTLPLVELETRWEVDESHPFYARGIDETMSIDGCLHSIFGASKVAADVMVQEYGRYFGMKTACFRPGCLTGPAHAGAELHGFLAYLMKCTATGRPYTVYGYKGKQVRDNIHSADLIDAFCHFIASPTSGEVYNIGASREACCSMIEGIEICEDISTKKLNWSYQETNRIGDHIWWIGDPGKFERHYPGWKRRYGLREILSEIHQACVTGDPLAK